MSRLGWVRDKSLAVERAFADRDGARLARLVDELIRKHVEVVLAVGQSAPTAVARATRAIPIVFMESLWPLERGLIDSYARPGRNVTGIAASIGVEATTKRLDFLREVVPSATRLSWTASPSYFSLETVSGRGYNMIPVLEGAAKERGFESRFHEVRDGQNLDRLFGEIIASSAQALMSVPMPSTAVSGYMVLAIGHRLPSASFNREYVQAGCLIGYGSPDLGSEATAMRSAEYVDRILRGARPEDMPVYTPDKYELVINLKTARALGLTIPQSLLLRANEVIR
jgi:putative ABC transport system substrate-binding protein